MLRISFAFVIVGGQDYTCQRNEQTRRSDDNMYPFVKHMTLFAHVDTSNTEQRVQLRISSFSKCSRPLEYVLICLSCQFSLFHENKKVVGFGVNERMSKYICIKEDRVKEGQIKTRTYRRTENDAHRTLAFFEW